MTELEAAGSMVAARKRRLLWALGAAVFMVNLDARVVAPLLPTVANELGVSLARAAWLMSAYMLPLWHVSVDVRAARGPLR